MATRTKKTKEPPYIAPTPRPEHLQVGSIVYEPSRNTASTICDVSWGSALKQWMVLFCDENDALYDVPADTITNILHQAAPDGPRFQDVPQFTRYGRYEVDVPWEGLDRQVQRHRESYGLQIDPDFQRAHVWSQQKQVDYIEYVLRGGKAATTLYFNHEGWSTHYEGEYVLVDGKQRLEAVRSFMHNKIRVMGHYFWEYSDRINSIRYSFRWHINDLKTRAEVLKWYLDLNSGGVVHTEEELSKVKKMLDSEKI